MSRGGREVYYALVGELDRSRDHPAPSLPNPPLEERLRGAVATLNRALAGDLTVPFELWAGDEIRGLFRAPQGLVDVLVAVSDAALPAALSWGLELGRGRVTAEDPAAGALLDGLWFHGAREAAEEAGNSSPWIRVRGLGEPHGRVLEGLLNLMGAIRSEWTARQAEVVRKARGKRQAQVARELGVHRSTISRTLAAAHYVEVTEGEEAARSLLRSLGRSQPRFPPLERMKGR